eukprot:m.1617936 g.1617936  ORF g.1617936 m.1617936 type:complete len:59 (-) comp25375_c0_seq4:45-221(-)
MIVHQTTAITNETKYSNSDDHSICQHLICPLPHMHSGEDEVEEEEKNEQGSVRVFQIR